MHTHLRNWLHIIFNFSLDYRTKVLQKLQELCENQQDILAMQRKILAAVAVPGVEAEEEVLENGPCQTIEQIKQLDKSFDTPEKRTKMVTNK